MAWIITAVVVGGVLALVWWTSGRARPDLRQHSIDEEIAIREGSIDAEGRCWGSP